MGHGATYLKDSGLKTQVKGKDNWATRGRMAQARSGLKGMGK